MTPDRLSAGAYVRSLERALARLGDRVVVLSPRDGRLALDWHERGIPLGLVLECLEEAAAPEKRSRKPPRPLDLARVGACVEEAWAVVLDGRIETPEGGPDPSTDPGGTGSGAGA